MAMALDGCDPWQLRAQATLTDVNLPGITLSLSGVPTAAFLVLHGAFPPGDMIEVALDIVPERWNFGFPCAGGNVSSQATQQLDVEFLGGSVPRQGRYSTDVLITMSEQPYAKVRGLRLPRLPLHLPKTK